MSIGHAHSHRPRRRIRRVRSDIEIADQLGRVARRRLRLAEGPREVVAPVPWDHLATGGQQSARPPKPGSGMSRWVREALERQAKEAGQ